MAFVIFLLDIIYRSVAEIIGLFPVNRNTAIATIVMFSIIGGIVLVPYAILVFCKYIERSCTTAVAWIGQIVLAGLYYYGKNINGIFLQYGTHLGCDEACQRTNRFVALFCLLLAILFFTHVIPELHKKKSTNVIPELHKKKSTEDHHTYWCYFFGVILIFVSANAIYATISLIPVDIQCTIYAVTLSSIFLCIITFVGWFKIWSGGWNDDDSHDDDSCDCPTCSEGIFICFTYLGLLVALPFYLLGDNQLPLVYIRCNTTFEGSTELESGGTADHIVRIFGMLVTVVVVFLVFVLFWRDRKNI